MSWPSGSPALTECRKPQITTRGVVPLKFWSKQNAAASSVAAKRSETYSAPNSDLVAPAFCRPASCSARRHLHAICVPLRFPPLQLASQNFVIRFFRRLNQLQPLSGSPHAHRVRCLHRNSRLPIEG